MLHQSQQIEIKDGGTLRYFEAFLSRESADQLFERLRVDTPWKQERGRMGPFPRLTAWHADPDLTYRYSGVTHHALPWTEALQELRGQVEARVAGAFNSVLLNYYRDGQDSMGYHSDAESELGINPVIASISLGAVRRFVLKHERSGEKMEFHLGHGSLLVMGGTTQHFWRHGLPKMKAEIGARINLTFRQIVQ